MRRNPREAPASRTIILHGFETLTLIVALNSEYLHIFGSREVFLQRQGALRKLPAVLNNPERWRLCTLAETSMCIPNKPLSVSTAPDPLWTHFHHLLV